MSQMEYLFPDGYQATVEIIWRPMPFGGERAFLLCVDCGAPREILFAPFMQCKDCKGVAYRSENLSRYRRKEHRVRKLRAKVGADFDGPLVKPHGMHFRTFDAIVERIEDAEEALNLAWLGSRSMRALFGWR